MKSGVCIKCKSSEVYSTENGQEISLGINSRERGNFTFTTYVCLNCGYTESYLNSTPPEELTENIKNESKRAKLREMYRFAYEERLQKIRANWKKVGW